MVSTLVQKSNHLSSDDISFVLNLSKEAGQVATEMRHKVAITQKTGPNDLVTEADFAVSKLLTTELSRRFPDDIIISEEDEHTVTDKGMTCPKYSQVELESKRVWLIDPIDGTESYINNSTDYSVMIGLLVDLKPVFGWVSAPKLEASYYGGPDYGAFKLKDGDSEPFKYGCPHPLSQSHERRIVIGSRDRRGNPWISDIPNISWVHVGSVGIKVAKVLDNIADVFIHLSGQLKTWDTAGPLAIAYGGGLEAGSFGKDGLSFPLPALKHGTPVIIGRPGSLEWTREIFRPHRTADNKLL